MANSESTVAIIGTGNIGSRLAADWAAGGQDFLLAGRDANAARKIAAGLARGLGDGEPRRSRGPPSVLHAVHGGL